MEEKTKGTWGGRPPRVWSPERDDKQRTRERERTAHPASSQSILGRMGAYPALHEDHAHTSGGVQGIY